MTTIFPWWESRQAPILSGSYGPSKLADPAVTCLILKTCLLIVVEHKQPFPYFSPCCENMPGGGQESATVCLPHVLPLQNRGFCECFPTGKLESTLGSAPEASNLPHLIVLLVLSPCDTVSMSSASDGSPWGQHSNRFIHLQRQHVKGSCPRHPCVIRSSSLNHLTLFSSCYNLTGALRAN